MKNSPIYIVLIALVGAFCLSDCKKDPQIFPDYPDWEVLSQYNSNLPVSMYHLLTDGEGSIWGCSVYGKTLYERSGSNWVEHPIPGLQGSSNNHSVTEVCSYSDGSIWMYVPPTIVQGEPGLLYKLANGQWLVFNGTNGFISDYYCYQFSVDELGNVWLASQIGLVNYNGATCTIFPGPDGNVPSPFIAGDHSMSATEIISVYAVNSTNIWLGAINPSPFPGTTGLNNMIDSNVTVYTDFNSALPSNAIVDIEKDIQGNIWFLTGRNEIVELRDTSWFVYDSNTVPILQGVNFDNTSPIVVGGNNEILFCSSNKGVIRLSNGRWSSYNRDNSGMPSNCVYDVAKDIDGKLWIATDKGLAIYSN